MPTKQELIDILKPVKQEHILQFWDELSKDQKKQLETQIREIDWPTVTQWALDAIKDEATSIPFDKLKPAPYYPLVPETNKDIEFYDKARKKGVQLLKDGKVAAFTVAGGQGTRLGYDGPKGTFKVSPAKNKSLFQIFAESIICNQNKYGCKIKWYIMTSKINDVQTREFFAENNYFGLDEKQVKLFTQATLPAFGLDGKALLEAKDSLALSPNGHGGSFEALKASGALDDMIKNNITHLSYWQVDNPLIMVMDPLFIGMHHLTESDMSSRALIKRDYAEKLGHFCILDNKLIIVEYSDMPEALAKQTDCSGRLAFRAGSPAMHVLKTAFIERMTSGKLDFKPHKALKKVPHIDGNANQIDPQQPNAIKLEFFLFDALPLANNPLILEADRDEQFAPVKNKTGQDSPQSCQEALLNRAKKWLEEAGIKLPENTSVELSTKSFVEKQDVIDRAKAKTLPPLNPGKLNYWE